MAGGLLKVTAMFNVLTTLLSRAKMALQNAERAYVMALGRIAKKGSAAEIAASSDLEALYLGG